MGPVGVGVGVRGLGPGVVVAGVGVGVLNHKTPGVPKSQDSVHNWGKPASPIMYPAHWVQGYGQLLRLELGQGVVSVGLGLG